MLNLLTLSDSFYSKCKIKIGPTLAALFYNLISVYPPPSRDLCINMYYNLDFMFYAIFICVGIQVLSTLD